MSAIRHLIFLVLAVVFLNTLLTLQNVWPTPWVRPTAEISIEIAIIVLLITVMVEISGALNPALRKTIIAAVLILVVGRYADITAPALFGRPVDLFWDAPHLPRLVEMIVESTPLWRLAAYTIGVAALAAALIYAIVRTIDMLVAACERSLMRRSLGASAIVLVGLFSAGLSSTAIATEGWFSLPVTPVYVKQAAFLARATTADETNVTPLPSSNLKRLKGGDAFLIFFESYGAGAFEEPRMKETLAANYASLGAFLDQSKWHAASAFIDSPTFGGASWLAHSTTLSGRWINREADYRSFLANPSETLVDRFRQAGYRTVLLLPGIKFDWPEGQALRFDSILDGPALGYTGPAFGWWKIPDQYSLESLHQREFIRPDRQPLFVTFASIMSHMPFGPTPPYQPDWPRMTTATPFDPAPLEAALQTVPDWNDMTAGYLRTIQYDIELLQGFLENRAGKDAFVVVSGDHQPPAIISGKDASWSVPVHIFTQDPAILAQFVDIGFRPGMHPARPALSRMDKLNHMILEALDSSAAQVGR